jgi:DNA repair exonuclease SbcCD ATPase subunit
MSEQQNDPVNRPNHYIAGPYECAKVARAVFGDAAWETHCRITAWTYLWRAGKKGSSQEDMAKARRYLAWAEEAVDEQAELDRSDIDQIKSELTIAKNNEETLKAEISRLRQQALELARGRNELFKEVTRLEAIREQDALVIAEQRKEANHRNEIIQEKVRVIAWLNDRIDEISRAAKKRGTNQALSNARKTIEDLKNNLKDRITKVDDMGKVIANLRNQIKELERERDSKDWCAE